MMIQGLYAVWLARNEARDGKKIEEAHVIAGSVARYLDEWQGASNRERSVSTKKAGNRRSKIG